MTKPERSEFTFEPAWQVVLAFGLFAFMMETICYLAYRQAHEHRPADLVLPALYAVFSVWAILYFTHYRVVITAEALTLLQLWRSPRYLRWHEITSVRRTERTVIFRGRGGQSLSISSHLPRVSELIAAAEERALEPLE